MGAVSTEHAARTAAEAQARLNAAHAQLRGEGAIQFDLPPAPPPPRPPAWFTDFSHWLGDVMRPVGRFFAWLFGFLPDAPYARIIIYVLIALLVAGLGFVIYERVRAGVWRLPRWRRAGEQEIVEEGHIAAEGPVRAWLQEADVLAGQGRFAEAVHYLLIRSVEDIRRRRPKLLRPALTARDIAGSDTIPQGARELFAGIASVVERSLFGGRPVDREDWDRCRAAYADFAAGRSWALPR